MTDTRSSHSFDILGLSSIAPWHRAVIKVGSALVSPNGDGCSTLYLQAICDFIVKCKQQGKEIIVVSSGSIAAARGSIKTGLKPTIAEKQAMAAIGQMRMMANWAGLFAAPHNAIQQMQYSAASTLLSSTQTASASASFDCAQILVTVEDLADRKRFVNIKNTLEQLLANNVIPIVNENDTVAVDEIKVGDNDNLAAHTAIAAQADCLIICTDVDGLFTANPRVSPHADLIKKVRVIDSSILSLAGGAGSLVGTGGMITKLQAAQKCMQSGITTLLVNGTKASSFGALAKGECSGTIFLPAGNRQRAKQDWLAHTSKVKGRLFIDAGAVKALTTTGASLLAAGVVTIEGTFSAGESVMIMSATIPCGKGLVNYSSTELKRILGCKSTQIETILGYSAGEAVIHRNNLVLATATT
jgi:glutamate 5-kinase